MCTCWLDYLRFSSGGNKSYVTKILSKKGALVFVRVQADDLGIWLVI